MKFETAWILFLGEVFAAALALGPYTIGDGKRIRQVECKNKYFL